MNTNSPKQATNEEIHKEVPKVGEIKEECKHEWMQNAPIKVCYKCGFKPNPESKESWENKAVGKNVHSVFLKCLECHVWGTPMPLETVCGNCGSKDTITYYDAETITILLHQTQQETREECANIAESMKVKS